MHKAGLSDNQSISNINCWFNDYFYVEVLIKNCEDKQASELQERNNHYQEMPPPHVQELLPQFVLGEATKIEISTIISKYF